MLIFLLFYPINSLKLIRFGKLQNPMIRCIGPVIEDITLNSFQVHFLSLGKVWTVFRGLFDMFTTSRSNYTYSSISSKLSL